MASAMAKYNRVMSNYAASTNQSIVRNANGAIAVANSNRDAGASSNGGNAQASSGGGSGGTSFKGSLDSTVNEMNATNARAGITDKVNPEYAKWAMNGYAGSAPTYYAKDVPTAAPAPVATPVAPTIKTPVAPTIKTPSAPTIKTPPASSVTTQNNKGPLKIIPKITPKSIPVVNKVIPKSTPVVTKQTPTTKSVTSTRTPITNKQGVSIHDMMDANSKIAQSAARLGIIPANTAPANNKPASTTPVKPNKSALDNPSVAATMKSNENKSASTIMSQSLLNSRLNQQQATDNKTVNVNINEGVVKGDFGTKPTNNTQIPQAVKQPTSNSILNRYLSYVLPKNDVQKVDNAIDSIGNAFKSSPFYAKPQASSNVTTRQVDTSGFLSNTKPAVNNTTPTVFTPMVSNKNTSSPSKSDSSFNLSNVANIVTNDIKNTVSQYLPATNNTAITSPIIPRGTTLNVTEAQKVNVTEVPKMNVKELPRFNVTTPTKINTLNSTKIDIPNLNGGQSSGFRAVDSPKINVNGSNNTFVAKPVSYLTPNSPSNFNATQPSGFNATQPSGFNTTQPNGMIAQNSRGFNIKPTLNIGDINNTQNTQTTAPAKQDSGASVLNALISKVTTDEQGLLNTTKLYNDFNKETRNGLFMGTASARSITGETSNVPRLSNVVNNAGRMLGSAVNGVTSGIGVNNIKNLERTPVAVNLSVRSAIPFNSNINKTIIPNNVKVNTPNTTNMLITQNANRTIMTSSSSFPTANKSKIVL